MGLCGCVSPAFIEREESPPGPWQIPKCQRLAGCIPGTQHVHICIYLITYVYMHFAMCICIYIYSYTILHHVCKNVICFIVWIDMLCITYMGLLHIYICTFFPSIRSPKPLRGGSDEIITSVTRSLIAWQCPVADDISLAGRSWGMYWNC